MDTSGITIEMKRLDSSGAIKAFADVTIQTPLGEITLKGFRVVKKDDQEEWVALPSTSYMKNGKRINIPILEVTKGLKKQLQELILAEFGRVVKA